MKIDFNKEQELALEDLGIKVKDDYTDDDLLQMEELVGDEICNHFDKKGNPSPKALLYESIIDIIVEVD